GKEIRRFEGHKDGIARVAFSPDGKRALSGCVGPLQGNTWGPGTDTAIRLWDVDTGKEIRRLVGHTSHVWGLAFSPDGRQAASCGEDKTIRIWNLDTGKELRRLEGHTAAITGVVFSPDGRQLLSSSWDRTARLWDATTGKEIRRFEGHKDGVMCAVFSKDGQLVLSGSMDRMARMWKVGGTDKSPVASKTSALPAGIS